LIADLIKNDEIDKIRTAIDKVFPPDRKLSSQALINYQSKKISKEEAMRNADSASNLFHFD